MTPPRRFLTIVVHRDGATASRSIRLPMWFVRFLSLLGTVVGITLVLAAILYAPIARTAARVPGLNREVAELRADNAQVRELAQQLATVEASYDQLQTMLGVDVVPNRARFDNAPVVAYAIIAAPPDAPAGDVDIPSRPSRWPLDEPGIVTRGPVPKHCIPTSVLDPKRLIFYGGTAAGNRMDPEKFFAYDIRAGKVISEATNGPAKLRSQ